MMNGEKKRRECERREEKEEKEEKRKWEGSNRMADKENYDLSLRTRSFALRIIRLYTSLPKKAVAQVLGNQLLRSGTSVGAHYREAKRARSVAEFISKIECGLQELEESIYWLELLIDAKIVKESLLRNLLTEAEELTAILVSSVKTAKKSK